MNTIGGESNATPEHKKPEVTVSGRMSDFARAEPVAVANHGRTVVVVTAVAQFKLKRMKALEERTQSPKKKGKT